MNQPAAASIRPINGIPGIAARFIGRIPGVDIALERHEAMALLEPHHHDILRSSGLGNYPLVTAEQVHGKEIALIESSAGQPHHAGVDGMLTEVRGVTLGIAVADCAPVWIVARDGCAGALIHSGKKGTALGIVSEGIRAFNRHFSLAPSDLILVIGPCIRPPCYEVDFAAQIRTQALESGLKDIHDELTCTACHPGLYYSYRREKGLTGRMLATLTLLPHETAV